MHLWYFLFLLISDAVFEIYPTTFSDIYQHTNTGPAFNSLDHTNLISFRVADNLGEYLGFNFLQFFLFIKSLPYMESLKPHTNNNKTTFTIFLRSCYKKKNPSKLKFTSGLLNNINLANKIEPSCLKFHT